MEYIFSPSEIDYKTKCKRCFYLLKNNKISPGDRPPPVFSSFDVSQKRYFITKNSKDLTDQLPDGEFMDNNNLPGKIVSENLKDNKGRNFKLRGIPDIVIKFKEKGYGIIDFKTTNLSDTKSENYKYQLEAYAQIFTHPGSTGKTHTPKLNPITHMGILQFYPSKMTNHESNEANQKMSMLYSPLKRDEKSIKGFFDQITSLIDLLENKNIPELNEDCKFCNFVKKQIDVDINGEKLSSDLLKLIHLMYSQKISEVTTKKIYELIKKEDEKD